MKKHNEKDNPVNLKDGQNVIVDGQEMIFDKGHFRLNLPEKDNTNNHHFYLQFHPTLCKDIDEVKGFKVVKNDKYVLVDIYPIIEELFGSHSSYMGRQFDGVIIDTGTDNYGCIAFSGVSQNKLVDKLNRMLEMSVVNQKQLSSYKSYIDDTFNELWRSFYHSF